MRRRLSLLILCLLVSLCGTTQSLTLSPLPSNNVTPAYATASWATMTTSTAQNLKAVSCASMTFCIAVGATGLIKKWTSGSSYTAITGASNPVTSTPTLNGVSCFSSTFCMAVGTLDIIVITTDGANWTQLTNPDGQSATLDAVSCPSATTCVFTDASGHIYYSTNLPTSPTWNTVTQGGFPLPGASCPSVTQCSIVSTATTSNIKVTSNLFGATTASSSGDTQSRRAVTCPTTSFCVYTGDAGSIVTTNNPTNATPTYTLASGTGAIPYFGVSCYNATGCVAVGGSGSAAAEEASFDGGSTWAANTTGMSASNIYNAVSCATDGATNYICQAVGNAGQASELSDTLATATPTGTPTNTGTATNTPTPSNTATNTATPTATPTAIPAGTQWTPINNGSTAQLNTAACVTTSVCYLGGNGGLMQVWNGSVIYTMTTPFTASTNIDNISCGSQTTQLNYVTAETATVLQDTCLAVGSTGAAANTADGWNWSLLTNMAGNTTLEHDSCATKDFCAIVTSNGAIYTTTNLSTSPTWTTNTPFTGHPFYQIACPSTVRCIMSSGSTSKEIFVNTSVQTGAAWNFYATGTNQNANGLACPTINDCYTVGVSGTIGYSHNIGPAPTFSHVTTADGVALYSVSCIDAWDCVAVGGDGVSVVDAWQTGDGGATWTAINTGLTQGTKYLVSVSCTGVMSSQYTCVAVGLGGVAYALRVFTSAPTPTSTPTNAPVTSAMLVGGNADVDTLLPRSPYYFTSTVGDILDVAHAEHFNALRIGGGGAWADNTGKPQTGATLTTTDWITIATDLQRTSMKAILLLQGTNIALPVADNGAFTRILFNGCQINDTSNTTIRNIEWSEGNILANTPLIVNGSVLAVDFINEAPGFGTTNNGATLVDSMNEFIAFSHCAFPSVPVTFGGTQGNDAEDGIVGSIPFQADIFTPHIYQDQRSGYNATSNYFWFCATSQTVIRDATLWYLQQIALYAGNKPILVGEGGSPNGDFGAPNVNCPSGSPAFNSGAGHKGAIHTPAQQNLTNLGVADGIVSARALGINITGYISWSFTANQPYLTGDSGSFSAYVSGSYRFFNRQGVGNALKIYPVACDLAAEVGLAAGDCTLQAIQLRNPLAQVAIPTDMPKTLWLTWTSNAGSDANNCLNTSPCLTLARASALMTGPGPYTVIYADGTYSHAPDTLTTLSGTAPVTVTAENPAAIASQAQGIIPEAIPGQTTGGVTIARPASASSASQQLPLLLIETAPVTVSGLILTGMKGRGDNSFTGAVPSPTMYGEIDVHGLAGATLSGVIVQNTQISHSDTSCIGLENEPVAIISVTLSDCGVAPDSGGLYAAGIAGPQYGASVVSSVISGTLGDGVILTQTAASGVTTGPLISSTIVVSSSQDGIAITGNGGGITRTISAANTGAGLVVGGSQTSISQDVLANNTTGITVTTLTANSILSGNTFSRNTGSAVVLGGALADGLTPTGSTSGNTFIDNLFYGTGSNTPIALAGTTPAVSGTSGDYSLFYNVTVPSASPDGNGNTLLGAHSVTGNPLLRDPTGSLPVPIVALTPGSAAIGVSSTGADMGARCYSRCSVSAQ